LCLLLLNFIVSCDSRAINIPFLNFQQKVIVFNNQIWFLVYTCLYISNYFKITSPILRSMHLIMQLYILCLKRLHLTYVILLKIIFMISVTCQIIYTCSSNIYNYSINHTGQFFLIIRNINWKCTFFGKIIVKIIN